MSATFQDNRVSFDNGRVKASTLNEDENVFLSEELINENERLNNGRDKKESARNRRKREREETQAAESAKRTKKEELKGNQISLSSGNGSDYYGRVNPGALAILYTCVNAMIENMRQIMKLQSDVYSLQAELQSKVANVSVDAEISAGRARAKETYTRAIGEGLGGAAGLGLGLKGFTSGRTANNELSDISRQQQGLGSGTQKPGMIDRWRGRPEVDGMQGQLTKARGPAGTGTVSELDAPTFRTNMEAALQHKAEYQGAAGSPGGQRREAVLQKFDEWQQGKFKAEDFYIDSANSKSPNHQSYKDAQELMVQLKGHNTVINGIANNLQPQLTRLDNREATLSKQVASTEQRWYTAAQTAPHLTQGLTAFWTQDAQVDAGIFSATKTGTDLLTGLMNNERQHAQEEISKAVQSIRDNLQHLLDMGRTATGS